MWRRTTTSFSMTSKCYSSGRYQPWHTTGRYILRVHCGLMNAYALPCLSCLLTCLLCAYDWKAFVNKEHLSDISIVVSGQTIYAHRVVLAARCSYFRAMFGSGMRDATQVCMRMHHSHAIPIHSHTLPSLSCVVLHPSGVHPDRRHRIQRLPRPTRAFIHRSH